VEEQDGAVLGVRPGDDRLLARLPTEVLLWLQPRLGHPLSQSALKTCSIIYVNLCALTC